MRVFSCAVMAALLPVAAGAAPAVFSFDDFSATQPTGGTNVVGGYLTDTSPRAASCNDPMFGGTGSFRREGANAVAVTSPVGNVTRSISINLCSGSRPFSGQIGVNVGNGGVLEIINNVGEVSVGGLRYDLGTGQFQDEIDAYAAANGGAFDELGLAFQVVAADANPVTVRAFLNGDELGSEEIGANFSGQFVFFVDPATDLSGQLDLVFTGGAGYDIAIDGVGLYLNNTTFVPAPATMALFGLGLIGLAAGRRRA